DREGHFRLSIPRTSSMRFYRVAVVAAGKGLGIRWHYLDLDDPEHRVKFRLTKALSRRGKLVDLQGQPAAGVKVGLLALIPRDTGGIQLNGLPVGLPGWPRPAISSVQGRFVLDGLDPNHGVLVEIRSDRFATQQIELAPVRNPSAA